MGLGAFVGLSASGVWRTFVKSRVQLSTAVSSLDPGLPGQLISSTPTLCVVLQGLLRGAVRGCVCEQGGDSIALGHHGLAVGLK